MFGVCVVCVCVYVCVRGVRVRRGRREGWGCSRLGEMGGGETRVGSSLVER